MSLYFVIRNNRTFGPYDAPTLADMVSRGKVLRCDKAVVDGAPLSEVSTVGRLLKNAGFYPKVRSNESVWRQIKNIGTEVIFPSGDLRSSVWRQDSKLMVMALVGLLPILCEFVGGSSLLTFYFISLYFSTIWGLFYYYLFKTQQVNKKTTFTVFFMTQAFVFAAWDLFGIASLNPFYLFEDSNTIVGRLIYFIGGVGLTEEFAKALPLLIITARAKEPLIPQTMVYYGLMSGIAFGVFEGVQYQLTVNAEYGYSESFLLNIARLTTLPFAHSLWAGIAGYFISFALLYPAYKWALWVLAILVPAILHGLYDTSCDMGLFFVRGALIFLSALLLISYLKRGKDLQSRLSQLTLS